MSRNSGVEGIGGMSFQVVFMVGEEVVGEVGGEESVK